MMRPADWYREFIADLPAECLNLRKTQVVGIRGLAAANDARLCGDKFAVPLITQPSWTRNSSVLFEITDTCSRRGGWTDFGFRIRELSHFRHFRGECCLDEERIGVGECVLGLNCRGRPIIEIRGRSEGRDLTKHFIPPRCRRV